MTLLLSSDADYLPTRSREDSRGPNEPCIRWDLGALYEKGHFRGTCTRHPLGNGRVQSSRPLVATNTPQQVRDATAMRAVDCLPTRFRETTANTTTAIRIYAVADGSSSDLNPDDRMTVSSHVGFLCKMCTCKTADLMTLRIADRHTNPVSSLAYNKESMYSSRHGLCPDPVP